MQKPPSLTDRRTRRQLPGASARSDAVQDADQDEPDADRAAAPGGDAPSALGRGAARQLRASPELSLWHVSVTFTGPALDLADLDAALHRLVDAQPFLASVRYAVDRAEVSYWDEAEDVDDAAALGLRLWAEHRRVAELPDWRPVGIEVVDRETYHARGQRLPSPTGLGEVRPW